MLKIKDTVGGRIILNLAIVFMVLIVGATDAFMVLKIRNLTKDLEIEKGKSEKNVDISGNFAKLQDEYNKIHQGKESLAADLSKLKNDYGLLESERDNIKNQAKELLGDKARAQGLDGEVAKVKKELEEAVKEREVAEEKMKVLQDQNDTFAVIRRQLIKEKDFLLERLNKEKERTSLGFINQVEYAKVVAEDENAKLKSQVDSLKNKSEWLITALKRVTQSETKIKEDLAGVSEKFNKLNKSYAEAVKKNKGLERKVGDAPRKYAEVARQNQVLVKENAAMHYNLGVFYTRQKEYSRAVKEFEKAVELNPNDSYSYFNLGYLYAEYLVNRPKAIEFFRQYLRCAKKDDRDADWVKKYIVTWETWDGNRTMQ